METPRRLCTECSEWKNELLSIVVYGKHLELCRECWDLHEKTYPALNKGPGRKRGFYCPSCWSGSEQRIVALFPKLCVTCSDREYNERAAAYRHMEVSHENGFVRPHIPVRKGLVGYREGRNLSLIEPGRDLVTDVKMVEEMRYLKKGIGRLWDAEAPRRGKKKR